MTHTVSLKDFRSLSVSFSKIHDVRKKNVKLQSLVNEHCDFTKKFASRYAFIVEVTAIFQSVLLIFSNSELFGALYMYISEKATKICTIFLMVRTFT